MKKIITLIITLALALSALTSCSFLDFLSKGDNAVIKIGVMSGPTGMGMAKLITDQGDSEEKYIFEIYSDPSVATTDLASGKLDMLCLPTNTAANLSKKQDISVFAINCLGSLYLLSDENTAITSVKDLEGKTIYTSVPNSTTGPIVNYILKENGVNATVETVSDHDTLVAMLTSKDAPIAVLPEPKVTAALLSNKNYSIDLNLSTEWSKVSDTPLTMGCIVLRNDFLDANTATVNKFLDEYKASIEYVNNKENLDTAAQMIVDAGVLPKLPIAKNALSNLYGSIVFQSGAEMKASLIAFYTAIGQALPDDGFYYEK